jgi:hypothetical protein
MGEDIQFISNELADLRRRVEFLEEKERGELGITKEIEFIMNRLRLMEKRISFLERVRR